MRTASRLLWIVLSVTVYSTSFCQNNVAIYDNIIYVSLASGGVGIVQAFVDNDTVTQNTFSPVENTETVDDLAIADGFLFLLDAQSPGYLSVLSLDDPFNPRLVSGPVEAPAEPYSGVSAANGYVVVSGGLNPMRVWTYNNETGELSSEYSETDLGLGQPDVTMDEDIMLVATDFGTQAVYPARFGVTIMGPNTPPEQPTLLDTLYLEGYGFTEGFQAPANFPVQPVVYYAERGSQSARYLLVAGGPGVALYALEDPTNSFPLGNIDAGFPVLDVAVGGDWAYVLGGRGGLSSIVSVDLSPLPFNNPKRIKNQQDFEEGCNPTAVEVTEDFVVIVGVSCDTRIRSLDLLDDIRTIKFDTDSSSYYG